MVDGITHSDITPDEDLGRVILLRAADIAPQVRTVPDATEAKKDAIAVLKRVANRWAETGTGAVQSMSRNGTSMTLRDVGHAFAPTDLRDLRLIFGIPESTHAGPLGSFPTDRPLSRIWPEGKP
ncbi:hypothetical protein [Microbacterium testaceum]|uniref:hypothetical protein n=1 Tax=Microbacterium testaceum TaxID=2033 RepID=UPI002434B22B|nr:hypothetical protein [Microbacterium testaceum]